MPCASDYVAVRPIKVDLAKNDFVQVITGGRVYQPVTGSTWPETQRSILGSQFTVVFWSDTDRTQGMGFEVKLDCQISAENEQLGAGFGAPLTSGKNFKFQN